jgi:hypothetical protein
MGVFIPIAAMMTRRLRNLLTVVSVARTAGGKGNP